MTFSLHPRLTCVPLGGTTMSSRIAHLITSIAVWMTVLLTAAAGAAPAPKLRFEKYTLKNGLDVILYEDHRLPLVAVNLWYHVGPANEREGRTGFAHLFEHMMFEGSKHAGPKGHWRYMEASGASDINGTTDYDRTNYFETLPSNQLELALWLESDRMAYLLPGIDAEMLANQRDVVRNERRQNTEGSPYGLVEEAMFHALFPKGHPYYANVIGSHQDIESVRLNDVREFSRQYYSPNNASLAITGDIDPVKAKALVEKYFSTIPSGPPVPKITATTPRLTSERRVVVTDQVELPRIYMGWLTPAIYQPGEAETNLLAKILGGGKSSRLYKSLVYEKQIAQDVQIVNSNEMLGTIFELFATAQPGVRLEDLEKAINEEITKLRDDGPTPAELDRARNVIQSQVIQGLQRLGGFGGVADRLNQYNHYLHNPDFLAQDLARYERTTTADLKRVANQQLQFNQRVVVYGLPGKKVIDDPPRTEAEKEQEKKETSTVANVMPEEEWRATAPQPAAASRFSLPVPASFKLANGLTVLLAEEHHLPAVSAQLVVLSGSDANPIHQPGLASFTNAMLGEGTARRSAMQVADDVAQIGATLDTGSFSDFSSVSIACLKSNVGQALDVLSDVVLHPKFDAAEIERIRKQRQTEILQLTDDPFQLAFGVFLRSSYGPDHPYGYRNLGTGSVNKTLTREEMLKFWQGAYVPGNSALVLAGDVTSDEARQLAQKYFGDWQGSAQKHASPAVEFHPAQLIRIVDKPNAPQSFVLVGGPGVPRSSPDYVPNEVMNNALGGLFSSRINMNLREKNGYTYGGFSFFVYRRAPGVFMSGGAIRTDVTAPAVHELLNELNGMRSGEVSPKELKFAKDAFSRSLAGLFETNAQSAATIGNLFTYDLPPDYWAKLPTQIDAVTAADIKRVADQYIHPEAALIVIAGDRAKIEPELTKLSVGSIEMCDADGNALQGGGANGMDAGKP